MWDASSVEDLAAGQNGQTEIFPSDSWESQYVEFLDLSPKPRQGATADSARVQWPLPVVTFARKSSCIPWVKVTGLGFLGLSIYLLAENLEFSWNPWSPRRSTRCWGATDSRRACCEATWGSYSASGKFRFKTKIWNRKSRSFPKISLSWKQELRSIIQRNIAGVKRNAREEAISLLRDRIADDKKDPPSICQQWSWPSRHFSPHYTTLSSFMLREKSRKCNFETQRLLMLLFISIRHVGCVLCNTVL